MLPESMMGLDGPLGSQLLASGQQGYNSASLVASLPHDAFQVPVIIQKVLTLFNQQLLLC